MASGPKNDVAVPESAYNPKNSFSMAGGESLAINARLLANPAVTKVAVAARVADRILSDRVGNKPPAADTGSTCINNTDVGVRVASTALATNAPDTKTNVLHRDPTSESSQLALNPARTAQTQLMRP
jgi:hypothetical protein